MDEHDSGTDVIVVGGGMAGLVAATYLARAGIAVRLFERAARPGGRAITDEHAGYAFNRGIHALYTGGAMSEVLAELGIRYSFGTPRATFVLHEGRVLPAPAHPLALIASRLLTVGDKLALIRLVNAIVRESPSQLARVSVAAWLERTISRPRLRALFTAAARTAVYTSALDLVSAEVLVDKLQRGLRHPVHYVAGGWQSLVDGLMQAAQAGGVRIVTSARVHALTIANHRVSGVMLGDGQVVPAANVIVAVNPHAAAELISRDLAPSLHQAIDSRLAAPLACLDVALRRLPNPRAPVVQDLEQPRFMSAQSQYTQLAPAGGAMISLFKQLDPRHLGAPHVDERELEELLDRTQTGWRKLLVRRAYLPRIEAVGLLPTAAAGGFAGRPGIWSAGVDNLLLAGDWIGAEGFLADASFASARLTAQAVLLKHVRAGAARASATPLVQGVHL